jgi:hypothetical protein
MATSRLGVALDWYGERYMRELRKAAGQGMRKAATSEKARIRSALGGPAGSPEGGPPGRESGALQDAIDARVRTSKNSTSMTIGVMGDDTEVMAYAARLAGGFVGRDALGRAYSQGARPFLDVDEATVVDAVVGEMRQVSI